MRTAALAVSVLAAAPLAAAPATAPRISADYADLKPLPLPYSASADANGDIAAARARALAHHKRLLIDIGANWCLNCRLLGGVMRLPRVAPFLAAHYEIVSVDIGTFDRKLDIPDRLGFHGRRLFVPAVIVIDPARGRIVNTGNEMAIANTRAMQPQAVVDWLARWTG